MTMLQMKSKLHDYLDVAGDKEIKALYTFLEAETGDMNGKYPASFGEELERRYAGHKADGRVVSRVEMDVLIEKSLSK